MMNNPADLLSSLFRSEYRKMVSVLANHFGFEQIDKAEDFVSETFLIASETWGLKGIPDNPSAWLYKVAKNKIYDFIKHNKVFQDKVKPVIENVDISSTSDNINFEGKNIDDSQLKMLFAICDPGISKEYQIALALRILFGLSNEEIANAFLVSIETINKRIYRAKEKIRTKNSDFTVSKNPSIENLESVLSVLYLLFNEGYYSQTNNSKLRKDLCLESLSLALLLYKNPSTSIPKVNALIAIICFHASRFDSRKNTDDKNILYYDQDTSLWNDELIIQGEKHLHLASQGEQLSKYHLEAAIAYWHCQKKDSKEKWENILQLYNKLLQLEYSPVAALNRTYALSRVTNEQTAFKEAIKLKLDSNHLYYCLLAHLCISFDTSKAQQYYKKAYLLAKTDSDKELIQSKLLSIDN